MPAIAVTPAHVASELQRRAAVQIPALLARVAVWARQAADQRRTLKELTTRLDNLRTLNVEFVNIPMREAVLYWTTNAGVAAVFAMDIVFAAPTAEFFAKRYLTAMPQAAAVAPYILPLVVICIELLIGAKRSEASAVPADSGRRRLDSNRVRHDTADAGDERGSTVGGSRPPAVAGVLGTHGGYLRLLPGPARRHLLRRSRDPSREELCVLRRLRALARRTDSGERPARTDCKPSGRGCIYGPPPGAN
jgi:hypothetical protein